MTSIPSQNTQLTQYPTRSVHRAQRAMCCLPFQLPLFVAMRCSSVSIGAIANQTGIELHYTKRPLSELAVESGLMWLIQVGILRREVDGQGITDSFRLTPLGRYLVEKWISQGDTLPHPSPLDRISHLLNRWLRLPV
ncbi:MAG TPA: hypothetical protein DEG17_19940 [Cyanobacteria bacterium UBA11149]|nr:hypothetical protein [Cyanobacteria bacterium UBA11367]HBE56481.1 hypothetical protein [Cyanobacteria bacterium UBA11366]HBK66865.1 hypothetical protein [Cyanobacteria bacterium UBA11166]HBR76976.1 hypothetical protein [Cyanobacteria bacterium UBA11159]HBS71977.1 hypothetical protein [Cyanobacteria bacterium UBA11153]HBW91070.1 hypothetical protein [Cyanobacteria bacterium UBA11149]HCA97832.1 hypothetical protein [Cyanobacteria bacterium UBA9226]